MTTTTTTTTRTRTTNKIKKSSIPSIRKSMLEKGALLFKFEQPEAGSKQKEHVLWFEQMQELGFLVTTTGCILPYENFTSSSKGRPKGHKLSALFFKGLAPRYPANPNGWPVTAQVSHLCHRKSCINPNHLVYEEQWKNLKRTYCGSKGSCDCGVVPKCLYVYHNDNWKYEDTFITYGTKDFKSLISPHLSGYRYIVRGKDHYHSIDKKREQRNTKIHRKRKQKAPSNGDVSVSKKAKEHQ